MKRTVPLLLFAMVGLTGCTTLGGNIKGSFDCKAPGGTCAPMTSIDAQAVNSLGATTTAIDGTATDNARIFYAGVGDGVPVRTSDRVLKVVFPAHTDGTGIYRDEAVARVVVERGGWVPGPETIAARSPKGELAASARTERKTATLKTGSKVGDAMAEASGTPAATLTGAVGAPVGLREVAASLEAAPMPQLEYGAAPTASSTVPVGSEGAPTAEAIAAAKAGHRIGAPRSTAALQRASGRRGVGSRRVLGLDRAQVGAAQHTSSPSQQQLARVAFRAPATDEGSQPAEIAPVPTTDPIATVGGEPAPSEGRPQ
ncbi:hypothetical protein Q4F19_08470 [Sphingomonas sp. BIUV-7]|uniref:Conjugal transfer pilus assembly protein TraV n=1 Tax=Sphingomonas natans TaxID=3063330 RepID=A0ABT8Y7W8_9SPHN|nr:hypothetical protein [Sphingomonas sp. BIUV-7]MDO6414413.1 hypothetical protein [Sphingomonas sp. BIUV-7]